VRDSHDTFDFFGGATVIIGAKGEVRYAISRNILNKKRLDQQRDFICGASQRFWKLRDRSH
jgi:hypothetical protein